MHLNSTHLSQGHLTHLATMLFYVHLRRVRLCLKRDLGIANAVHQMASARSSSGRRTLFAEILNTYVLSTVFVLRMYPVSGTHFQFRRWRIWHTAKRRPVLVSYASLVLSNHQVAALLGRGGGRDPPGLTESGIGSATCPVSRLKMSRLGKASRALHL